MFPGSIGRTSFLGSGSCITANRGLLLQILLRPLVEPVESIL